MISSLISPQVKEAPVLEQVRVTTAGANSAGLTCVTLTIPPASKRIDRQCSPNAPEADHMHLRERFIEGDYGQEEVHRRYNVIEEPDRRESQSPSSADKQKEWYCSDHSGKCEQPIQ